MTRAWLIVADILVTILFFFSLVLFFLSNDAHKEPNPLAATDNRTISIEDVNMTLVPMLPSEAEQNFSLSAEDLNRMTEEEINKIVFRELAHNKYLDDSLPERLEALSAKKGDAVYIRIFKQEALLEVWIKGAAAYKHLKDYKICAYSGTLGPKEKEGDKQAPEGFYQVKKSALNPKSKFHLSFNLGYPNAYDRLHGRTGSFLMVHGNCVSIGCYAMTDAKIEEIYALVKAALNKGQKSVPVHIYPFKMTEANMAKQTDNRWFDFWMNLKEGYDYFEAEQNPPEIGLEGKRYSIKESEDEK